MLLILILANGLFAMSEIAIVSSRKARLERLAAEGSAKAKTALELANEPTQLLSTVQVGITLIGIVTGAYGGATLAKPLAAYFKTIPWFEPYSEPVSLAVVIVSITYLSLIIGELVPKRIALNTPEAIAVAIAMPMRFFSRFCFPVVKLLSFSTEILLRLLHIKESGEAPITEEEIKLLIAEGAEYGTVEPAEKDLVERVFRFGDMGVGSLMTPRTQVEWLDLEDPADYNLNVLINSRHSRLPVARENLDNLTGVIHTADVLKHSLAGQKLNWESYIEEPLMIPKSMRAVRLLELFQQTGNHIAVVIDEFGGMTGLVTIYDILEKLVGEIAQEDEADAPDMVQRADGSWLIDGLVAVDDFKDHFSLAELPGEDREHYQTLGGFITSYLNDIPQVADVVEWGDLRLEIMDMDRTRIDKVLVTVLEKIA